MNFCGIICEFNPFHNGHEYIIKKAKEITNLDVICLMSGDFVQRGEAAIQNKYDRAKNAVCCGASAVFELPTIYACSNAENFASGAIKILASLGVTHLAFGIEKTNLETLKKIAALKFENSERFQNAFKNEIQNGISYNTALKRSIAKEIGDEKIIEVLNKPNNILAIEYLTAILKQNCNFEIVAIERCDDGYYSEDSVGEFLSASSIREKLFSGEDITKFIPKNAKIDSFFDKNCQKMLKTLQLLKIRTSQTEFLSSHYDYNEGIEYRVQDMARKHKTFDETLSEIVTPRYRAVRVNKLLLYPLLGITKVVIENSFKTKSVTKLLAIDKNKKYIISQIKKNKVNVIIRNEDYNKLNKKQSEIIKVDLLASEIYQTITNQTSNIDKKNGTLFI